MCLSSPCFSSPDFEVTHLVMDELHERDKVHCLGPHCRWGVASRLSWKISWLYSKDRKIHQKKNYLNSNIVRSRRFCNPSVQFRLSFQSIWTYLVYSVQRCFICYDRSSVGLAQRVLILPRFVLAPSPCARQIRFKLVSAKK